MTDASTFGGQLDPGTTFGASFGNNSAPAPTAAPVTPAAQPQSSGIFGTGLTFAGFGAPKYTPADPNASALDRSADLLQQEIKFKDNAARNPIAQIMDPDGAARYRSEIPVLTEKLQQIQQQKQQQVDIQRAATNYGVPKSMQNPFMTNDTIDNYLLDRYKDGDFSVANDLKARGKGEWVQDFAAQATDGAGRRLKAAETAATPLSAAGNNQAVYDAARKDLTPKDVAALSAIGVQTVPDKAVDWQKIVAEHGANFAQTQQLHAQVTQKINNLSQFDGVVPKDVEASLQGSVPLGSTTEPAGFPVRTRGMDGQPGGVAPPGSVQTENFGLSIKDGGWSATNPEREKSFQAQLNQEDVKGAVNQYNIANKFRHEANDETNYTSAAGLALLKDTLGGVGRDVAEKSAAAGTVGLTAMMTKQQGGFEGWANRAQNELGAFQNWKNAGSKGPEPRISDATKQGLKLVAATNYQYALDQAKGRLGGALTYAGQIGKPLDQIPLDADLKNDLASAHEAGRRNAINTFRSLPSIVSGNQRVFFPQGANVQGAMPPRGPLPTLDNPPVPSPQTPNTTATQGSAPPAGSLSPFTPAGGGTQAPNDAVFKAIYNQESGGGRNTTTSVTGARGGMQIQPATFAQYAKPGEKIDNPADNQAVGRRIIDDLSAKYGGDPARIAVGYFSGPGNVAPPGSPTPWKNNRADPTGKTTASYVADVMRRMAPKAGEPGAPSPPISTANVPGQTGAGSFTTGRPGETDIVQKVIQGAPALGGIAGAVAGGPIGGGAGGVAGQAFQNYMRGEPVMQPNLISSGAAGVAGGIPTAGLAGTALRAGTAAAGGSVAGGIESGARGALIGAVESGVGAAVGEGAIRGSAALADRFGGFLGMSGHQTYSNLTPEAKTAYREAAHTVAEGRPEKPAISNPVADKAYDEKLADYEDAEAHLKSILPQVKPEEAAYAAKQVQGIPAKSDEAIIGRPIAAEKAAVVKELNSVRADVASEGAARGLDGSLSTASKIPDGPLSQLRTAANPAGKIPYTPEIETALSNAEMLATAPAPGGIAQVWDHLTGPRGARGELLEQERTALWDGDTLKAKALRQGADALLPEIERTAKAVFGNQSPQVMDKMKMLWGRYARMMKLSEDGDIVGTIAKGGPAGREANQAFKALATGDTEAQRMMNALVAYRKGYGLKEIATYGGILAGELHFGGSGIISAPIIAAKLASMARDFMTQRGAGRPVTMDALLRQQRTMANPANAAMAGRAGAVAGSQQAAGSPSPPISY